MSNMNSIWMPWTLVSVLCVSTACGVDGGTFVLSLRRAPPAEGDGIGGAGVAAIGGASGSLGQGGTGGAWDALCGTGAGGMVGLASATAQAGDVCDPGGTGLWTAATWGGLGGSGGSGPASDPAPALQCGLAEPAGWTYLAPVLSCAAVPRGVGGIIIPGTYQLTTFTEYGDSTACLGGSDQPRFQVLTLGPQSGSLFDMDSGFFDWPMTFDYGTAAETFCMSVTCSPKTVVHPPYGPFGPFETYTAVADRIDLFSPACHYQASFSRLGP